MPSGSKKRKASKKKKSPNPNSGPPSPNLLPLAHPGNGHVSTEDEAEDTFETPRSQPDPADLLPVKGSSDRVPVDKVESAAVEEILAPTDLAREESSQFYEARAENPEASIEQEVTVVPWRAVGSEITVDEGSGADEQEVTVVPWRAVGSEITVDEGSGADDVNVDGEAKEMNCIDEGLKVIIPGRAAEEDHAAIENSTPVTDVDENQAILVEEGEKVNADDNVKEMNDGSKKIDSDGLAEEKYTSIDNLNLVTKESSIGVGVSEDHDILVEGVGALDVDGGTKEMPTEEDYAPTEISTVITVESLVTVSEKNEAMVDEIVVVGDEGKELLHVDESLKDAQLYKLAEENFTLTEHRTVVTEEVSEHSEATAENLNKILVGIVDTSPLEKEVEVLAQQKVGEPTARTEIAPRSEVARGPLVVRRATLWNCCGLLDVFTSSDR